MALCRGLTNGAPCLCGFTREELEARRELRLSEDEKCKTEGCGHGLGIHPSAPTADVPDEAFLRKFVISLRNFDFDPVTSHRRSKEECLAFKNKLADYYELRDGQLLRCMLTGLSRPWSDFTAGHIWKLSSDGRGLPSFGLKEEDVSSARNGLLLPKNLETAFDELQVCFMHNVFDRSVYLVVLDGVSLRGKNIFDGNPAVLFEDVDGKPLKFPVDKPPFRRILSYLCKRAVKRANVRDWKPIRGNIPTYQSYAFLSDGASEPEE